jgi:hypothetical protein
MVFWGTYSKTIRACDNCTGKASANQERASNLLMVLKMIPEMVAFYSSKYTHYPITRIPIHFVMDASTLSIITL